MVNQEDLHDVVGHERIFSFVNFGLFIIWNNWQNFCIDSAREKKLLGYNFLSIAKDLHWRM